MLKLKGMKSSKMPVQPMSMRTKDFIQKICYRRAASVDMTRYGFISDSKMQPIGLMLSPLKAKLKKICDNNHADSLVNKSGAVKKIGSSGRREVGCESCEASSDITCSRVRQVHVTPEDVVHAAEQFRVVDVRSEPPLGNAPKWNQNRARPISIKLMLNADDSPAQANAKKIFFKLQKRNARLAMLSKDIPPAKESKKPALPLVRFK